KATIIIKNDVRIGTKRRPLKNDNARGNSTLLKRLYSSAESTPTRIPTNWLFILPKATGTSASGRPLIIDTAAGEQSVVTTKKPTKPVKAAAPSLSFDIP